MANRKSQYLTQEKLNDARRRTIESDAPNPRDVFDTFEEFEEYSDEMKRYMQNDNKMNAYMSAIIGDIMDSLCNCIRALVHKELLGRKDAMMMLAFFNSEQHERSLGTVLGMSLSLTSMCKSADLIPDGVDIFETEDGVGMGVNQDIDESDMKKFLNDFGDGEVMSGFSSGAKA